MLGNDAVTELAWATAPWGAQTLPQQRGAWTRITRMQEVKNLQTDRKKYYYKTESEKIQLKRVLKWCLVKWWKYVLQFLASATSPFLINSQVNMEKWEQMQRCKVFRLTRDCYFPTFCVLHPSDFSKGPQSTKHPDGKITRWHSLVLTVNSIVSPSPWSHIWLLISRAMTWLGLWGEEGVP